MQQLCDQRLGVWWIAEDHPDLPAIVASPSGRRLTFAELAALAHRTANAMRATGITDGDVVAYALPNDVDAVVWQLATSEIGVHYLALNPRSSREEFATILDHVGAAGLVVHSDFLDKVADSSAATRAKLRVVHGPADDSAGFLDADQLIAGHSALPPPNRRYGELVRSSSGTTGNPKSIVPHTVDRDPSEVANDMTLFGRAFSFEPLEGVHLVSTGMHHGGCQGFYLGALNIGQSLAIAASKFDAAKSLAMIEQYSVTTAYMVATQFVRMLKLPVAVRHEYDVSSLKVVVHSAAPCPLEVKMQMFDWWGPVLWETYGGTEGAATIAKPHRWLEKPGTVGRTVRGMRVKILDSEGNELGPNAIGEVYLERVDGEQFAYLNDPEQTASVFRGRAFTIGDIGYLDEDGYLFICDRAKDMIISGGVNIYPAEIEGVLLDHPMVADAAVLGIPDPEWGEQVKAIVELVDSDTESPDLAAELIAFCRTRLAGYKCPRSVDFEQQLPRTEAGKLLKRELRARFWAQAGRSI